MSSEPEANLGTTTVALLHVVTPPLVRATVHPWREHAVSPWSWRHSPNQAGASVHPTKGEAGGLYVVSDDLGGCRAYLKPLCRPNHEGQVRAAREKIVSDIAHDLGVSVPPVLLYDRGGTPSGEERFVCVSRVMYPRQWSWQETKQLIIGSDQDDRATKIVTAALAQEPARAFALDAWVGQPDHDDHPHNIVFGYQPSATPEGHFVFLDYAWSLGYARGDSPYNWDGEGWNKTIAPPFPPHMLRFLDKGVLDETVARIENMEDKAIKEVVERIPGPFLPEDQRTTILNGLLGRKTLVRQIVSQSLPHS